MRQIRKILQQDWAVEPKCTNVFVDFMRSEKPLGGSTYSLLQLFNKSITDKRHAITVYARFVVSVESIICSIIRRNRSMTNFNSFVVDRFFEEKVKDPTDKLQKSKWLDKVKNPEPIKPYVEDTAGKIKIKVSSLLSYYLYYAKERIDKQKLRSRSKVSGRVNLILDSIEKARNVYVHTGAVPSSSGYVGNIEDLSAMIMALFVEFYGTYAYPTFWDNCVALRNLSVETFNGLMGNLKNYWQVVKNTCGEWVDLLKGVFMLLKSCVVTILKWGAAVVAGILAMCIVYSAWERIAGTPFEDATFAEIRSVTPVEYAHLHADRAKIANKLRYNGGKNDIADQIHKRTAGFNRNAANAAYYPSRLVYALPFVLDIPLGSKCDEALSKWNNAMQNICENYSPNPSVPERYDNPPAFELYSNYFFCDFIHLRNWNRSPESKEKEMAKLQKLCQKVKSNPYMELCIVYDKEDTKLVEEIKKAIREMGGPQKQLKTCKMPLRRSPKLYVRMDNRYTNRYSSLAVSEALGAPKKQAKQTSKRGNAATAQSKATSSKQKQSESAQPKAVEKVSDQLQTMTVAFDTTPYFVYNTDRLSSSVQQQFDQFSKVLIDNPAAILMIRCGTETNEDNTNNKLLEKRWAAVANYFYQRGVKCRMEAYSQNSGSSEIELYVQMSEKMLKASEEL